MSRNVRMFDIDLSAVAHLAKELETFAKRAVPHATRNALNSTAFEARKEWVGQMDKQMVLRNTFTTRSVRVEKATGNMVRTMESRVGSVAPYMATQEDGGTEAKHGKHGKPIPTSSAAGQGQKARPRTKQVQRKNWMSALNPSRPRVSGSRQRRNAVAILMAAKSTRTVFLDLGKRKGIFRITGTKRLKLRMMWDLSKPQVVIKRNPTLGPTLDAIQPRLPAIWEDAIRIQMHRNKVFGYFIGPRKAGR